MTAAEIKAVRASENGIDHRTPSRPKKAGSRRAKPTPKSISRDIDRAVEAAALPMACRKIKAALLTQAKTTAQR